MLDDKPWGQEKIKSVSCGTHILLFPPGSVVTFTKLIKEELVHYI